MAEKLGSNAQNRFYILKSSPEPSVPPVRTGPRVISTTESVVDRAVEELKREREEEQPERKKKRKYIRIISDNLS